MVSTWIEASATGRHGGPVRAGLWSAVVVGTHPVEADQEVWLEISADEASPYLLPAYWLENRGVNSFWHVPMPPQPVGARIRYRSGARRSGGSTVFSVPQEVVVRPNLPSRVDRRGATPGAEGLVGNRHMTVLVDGRGSTHDVYFPTTGLHSDVRPAEGDLPESRAHFRAIMGGLALGPRIEWFEERLAWESFQSYQGATNILTTTLRWRHGPVRVVSRDFVATGPDLPKTPGGTESPGQYLKRFEFFNDGPTPRRALFGLYIHAEVNGGVGEPGLSWHDGDAVLLATNRGHGHANRKLARDATVEFAVALDTRGESVCETAGPNEAMLFRWVDLPAGGSTSLDVLVSGAFTGWRGDQGTFEHWLRPAMAWFRNLDLDRAEQEAAESWDRYVEPLPDLRLPRSTYGATLRRSALAAALHSDAKWGAVVTGYDRGLHAYCWPRDTMFTGLALLRAGHVETGRAALDWIARVRSQSRPYSYWFQKYTTDGWPEWETPAIDQTAMIPWALERYIRWTGDLDYARAHWQVVEQAAAVCCGLSGHPGLSWIDDLSLISSGGIWDSRYGAFLYSNSAVVAGLRAAARLGRQIDRADRAEFWEERAGRIWERGVLAESPPDGNGPGLLDPETGRFLDGRRISRLKGLWSERPEWLLERSAAVDISLLGPALPFGLLPVADPRLVASAEAILSRNAVPGDGEALTCWSAAEDTPESRFSPGESHRHDPSSLANLWMARYLLRLGRETGDPHRWRKAMELIHDVLARLGPLGLAFHVGTRRRSGADPNQFSPGVWNLHGNLLDTLMDLVGVDCDAIEGRVTLDPVLPEGWPELGQRCSLPFGRLEFNLARTAPNAYRLVVHAESVRALELAVRVTCPGLKSIKSWAAGTDQSRPSLDTANGRLAWSATLPQGSSTHCWEWSAG